MAVHSETRHQQELGDSLHPAKISAQEAAATFLAERGSFDGAMSFFAIQGVVASDDVMKELRRQEANREHIVAAFGRMIDGDGLNEYEQTHVHPSLHEFYKLFRAVKLKQVK
jgi:hypothetical protein